MAQSGSRSAHLIKQMSTHTSMHLQYALTVVEAELLSPIKDACHVCVVCFCLLLMPGPSGSSQVNKSMSFDKHASHPRAYVLPGARDSSELTLLMFESPRWDPASLISRLADSIHTHSYCSHREQPLFFFSSFFSWWLCLLRANTHTQHLVIPSHVEPRMHQNTQSHTSSSPFLVTSSSTSLRQH